MLHRTVSGKIVGSVCLLAAITIISVFAKEYGSLSVLYEAPLILIAPGGVLFSTFLISFNVQPWQGLTVQLLLGASFFALMAWRRTGSLRRRHTLAALLLAGTTGGCWMYFPATEMAKEEDGFPVARYAKMVNGIERHLVFIGEQHISDLEYYQAMNAEIGHLTAAGYVFAYEETDAYRACKGWTGLNLNTATYNLPVWHYFVDVMHSPIVWPSANRKMWHRVDLGKNASASQAAAAAHPEDAALCLSEVQNARDSHLLREIDESNHLRDVAVVYGAAHLRRLRAPLQAAGWTETELATLPSGRNPFRP